MIYCICRPDHSKWKICNIILPFPLTLILFIGLSLTCHGASRFETSKEESVCVCLSGLILTLDPTSQRDTDTRMVVKNIFDCLTAQDRNNRVVPQLAESWHPVDQTSWEFKLRKGVRFHNGDIFSARDVEFTLNRVTEEGALDGQTSPRKALLEHVSKVEIVDRFTVRIITDKPWPILPLMLTSQEIVPSEYIRKVGSMGFEDAPVGTGPFRFAERKDGSIILKRFEDYYGGSHENQRIRVTPLKNLIFKIVEDPVWRTAMLKKGEADIAIGIPLETIPLLDALPDIEVMSPPATRSYFAEMNCMKPPFNNAEARRAANYAIDRRMLANMLFKGKGQILPTITPQQGGSAFNERLAPYPYDPGSAREALRQTSFSGDNTVKIACVKNHARFANAISLFLSKVGVKSRIMIGDKTALWAAMKNLEADILVTSWINTTLDPAEILLLKLKTNGPLNFSGFSNEKVDQLLSSAEGALSQQERDVAYCKVHEIISGEAPMIFGYATNEFHGVRKRVKNFYFSADGMLNLHDAYLE